MQNRLQQFLDRKNLSPARFAGIVGVQRSGVSHILSGRNNPSLDFISKILENFPDLNSEWFITGKGEMFKEESTPKITQPETPQKNLFETSKSVKDADIPEYEVQYEVRKITEVVENPEKNNLIEKQPAVQPQNSNIINNPIDKKDIERIVIFYKSGTFKEYMPENSP